MARPRKDKELLDDDATMPAETSISNMSQQKTLEIERAKRVKKALEPHHEITPNYAFKQQRELWANASEDLRHAIVYGMTFHDGAKSLDITRFFAIKPKDLEPYKETQEQAKVALKLKIQNKQIRLGLTREDNPSFIFNLTRQFAEQVSDPVHEGVEAVDTAPKTINYFELPGIAPEVRASLEQEVQAAISKAKKPV